MRYCQVSRDHMGIASRGKIQSNKSKGKYLHTPFLTQPVIKNKMALNNDKYIRKLSLAQLGQANLLVVSKLLCFTKG